MPKCHAAPSDNRQRQAIQQAFLADEDRLIHSLSQSLHFNTSQQKRIQTTASSLIAAHRRSEQRSGALDALLQEYALSTEEGLALMSLAEALLRIPDPATADALITDKLTSADWQAHLGHSRDSLVNASAWALMLTGSLLSESDERSLGSALKSALRRLGQPAVRQVLRFTMGVLGEHFVLGNTIGKALETAADNSRYRYSFDMLGEGARTREDAERYFERYRMALAKLGKDQSREGKHPPHGISVKLSALHPRFEYAHSAALRAELLPRLSQLAREAAQWDIPLTIDAEESWRLEPTLDVFEWLWQDNSLTHWDGLGLAVQAYQKRGGAVLDWALDLAKTGNRKIGIRLVKGAYWDTEIKAAQELGLSGYPVFSCKAATDLNYLNCAQTLLRTRALCFPQFATHNAHSIAAILELAGNTEGFEFQRLHGMGKGIYDALLENPALSCRVYAPVGEHQQLLPYLVRRLLENGANSSFVNQLAREDTDDQQLTEDPLLSLRTRAQTLPRPAEIYGPHRLNSRGFSLSDPVFVQSLKRNFQELDEHPARVRGSRSICSPADHRHVIGSLDFDSPESMEEKLLQLDGRNLPNPNERSVRLLHLADQLEKHRSELMWLCVREAGKTLSDALAEVREAVDFCRYYAIECRALPVDAKGRGIVLCISPWNFPLAILTGQITAALAAGNAVLAKPAEQTSLIAQRLLSLLRDSSFNDGMVNMVFAPGRLAGETLLPQPKIRAVMFTGSCNTARWINQRLAQRPDAPIPLIAETGGINAMVVDSSALHEQAIDDIIRSAFHSAGQRCSALRVLYLQEDIAEPFIQQLCGAMAELWVGAPSRLDTDIGPVIDKSAQQRLQAHALYLESFAQKLCELPLPATCKRGTFVAPQLWAIESIKQLREEVFGPILHVIPYANDDLDKVIDDINQCGYGLTFGIQTRIRSKAQQLAKRINAGNVYINRNMVGAVVGVQPFGGRGLSGTGPKAGGPMMIPRLLPAIPSALERPTTRNLPGPTGERNQLLFEAAGHFVAIFTEQDSAKEAQHTIEAILSCGNHLTLHIPTNWREDFESLSDDRLAIRIEPVEPATLRAIQALAGVVTGESNRLRRQYAEALAARSGPLCPLLTQPVSQTGLIPYLKEKTITENTAAIGGNAALLAGR